MTDKAMPTTSTRRGRRRAAHRRFSEVLEDLMHQAGDRVSVAQLLVACGDRAFGALLLVFAAPNVVPLPPGSSSVLGAPLIFVAAQLALGRQTLWLPPIIAQRSIAHADFVRILGKLLPWIARAEKVLRPRLSFLVASTRDRVIGAVCFALAVILFLPIPFGNMLPGLAISAFAFGLIERDGVAILFGAAVAVASIAVLVGISAALIAATMAILTHLGLPI